MPGGDRTGPRGMGAMSGRGAGHCGGSERRGDARLAGEARFGGGPGHGHDIQGRGGGGPWRWRHWFSATNQHRWMPFGGTQHPDPETEKQVLEARAGALQEELDSIRKRLEGFESPESED